MIKLSEILLKAYKIRKTELSLLDQFTKGTIDGTIHTCLGQELVGLSLAHFSSKMDTIISNHRCHGHYLSFFDDYPGLIAEVMGRPSGVNQGFGGSQHIQRVGFFSSGVQGSMIPSALGMSYSKKLIACNAGVVIVFIGDGTFGQGVLYESMNLASKHNLPILWVLENNQYAQSTRTSDVMAGSFKGRVESFDIEYVKSSTKDLPDLLKKAEYSLSEVRTNEKPLFLEIDTYRLGPHSKGDEIRDQSELLLAYSEDLVEQFILESLENIDIKNKLKKIDHDIEVMIEEVSNEPCSIQISNVVNNYKEISFLKYENNPSQLDLQIKDINSALCEGLSSLERAVILGEDIRDPYGGAFKATQGLSSKFDLKVLNMPISEASMVGMGFGLAREGVTTVVEIMFGDFISLAFDQLLNQVSKFNMLDYDEPRKIPLIIRTPMGGGRGYGATHSQSLEKFIYAIPNIDLYILHPRINVKKFYDQLLHNVTRPSIVIENKLLYAKSINDPLPTGYEMYISNENFSITKLVPVNLPDITVVSMGACGVLLEQVLEVLTDEEIFLDIIYPLDFTNIDNWIHIITDSARSTGKVLFLEEGTTKCNISSEIIKKLVLNENGAEFPKFRCLGARDTPIPAAKYLESQIIPSKELILNTLLEFFDE